LELLVLFELHFPGVNGAVTANLSNLCFWLFVGPHGIVGCFTLTPHPPMGRDAFPRTFRIRGGFLQVNEIDIIERYIEDGIMSGLPQFQGWSVDAMTTSWNRTVTGWEYGLTVMPLSILYFL
jgi:hypothetical protein